MKTRVVMLLAILLTLVVLPTIASAQTELVVWHAYRGKERTAFDAAVAAYNQDHAGVVTVKTLAVPYDAYADKITAAVPRGKGPDIFIYAQDRLGGWVEAGGIIETIDFYLSDDITERFIPTTLEAMVYQGNTYGLPMNYKVVTMIYNEALVSQPPRTSSELVSVAKELTNVAAGQFGLAYSYGDFYYHSALMNAFGGGVFGAGRDPKLDTPENIASLELMMTWYDTAGILPAEPSSTLITSLFNQGKAAIVFSGPWFLSEIADDIDYGLATLPTLDEAGGAPMQPWMTVEGVYISQPSQHKDEAFEFVLYITGEEAGKTMALEGRQTPANRLVYQDPAVQADSELQAFRAQVEHALPMPNFAEMTMVWSPATTAMNSIVRKASSPAAAMAQAQKEVVERVESLRK